MHFEGLFCIRRGAELQASQESQAASPLLPTPTPCFAALCHPRASILPLSRALCPSSPCHEQLPALWESQHCLQTHLSIDFPSPARPHQNGMGVRCDPAAPSHSTPLHGDRAQPCSELPGSRWIFPQRTRSGSVTPKSPSFSSSLPAAPLPCCRPVAGERADRGRFQLWHVSQA